MVRSVAAKLAECWVGGWLCVCGRILGSVVRKREPGEPSWGMGDAGKVSETMGGESGQHTWRGVQNNGVCSVCGVWRVLLQVGNLKVEQASRRAGALQWLHESARKFWRSWRLWLPWPQSPDRVALVA